MLVRYDYIDLFFKQKTFTNVDLDTLRQTVEDKGYGASERKAAMSLIEMHLAAYAVGSTLKDTTKINNKSRQFKTQQDKKSKRKSKRKQITSKSTHAPTGLSKSKKRKYNKMSEAKKLTFKMKYAVINLNSKRSDRNKKKLAVSKSLTERPKVEDAKTREISKMLKKRGENKVDCKHKQSQSYRGSKNTYIKIIYTRM